MRRFQGRARTAAIVGGLAVVAMLAVVLVWFQPQTLLIDREVREDLPGAEARGVGPGASEPVGAMSEPAGDVTEPAAGGTEPMGGARESVAADEPLSGPVALRSGTFVDRSHPTSGSASVYQFADGRRILRLEELATDNGPDLYVYLSAASADAPADELDDDVVDLGRLKGNRGDQNYDIPAGTDLDRYRTVVIWCRRFSVAFGTASLAG